jgi:hypothetical protein
MRTGELSPYRIGYAGEDIAAQVLPGCIQTNRPQEKRLHYDIIWENIPINVKYSKSFTKSGRVSFSTRYRKESIATKNVVMLCIADNGQERYYWVVPTLPEIQRGFDTRNSLTVLELPEMIRFTKKLMDSYK